MGGEIGVESEPTKGSKFWFTFKAKSAEKPEESKSISHHLTHERKALNILFAEDQRVNQMVISLMMKELGHTCTTVKNGKEAIKFYPTQKFDLILMDIKMPVMDGYKTTQKIRKISADIPILVQTAYTINEAAKKTENTGINEIISKPLKSNQFIQIIAKYL